MVPTAEAKTNRSIRDANAVGCRFELPFEDGEWRTIDDEGCLALLCSGNAICIGKRWVANRWGSLGQSVVLHSYYDPRHVERCGEEV